MTRALPVILISVLLIGGFIYAMGGQGEHTGDGGRMGERIDPTTLLGYDDPEGFPYELRELYRPPFGWRTVGYYPDERLCVTVKRRRERETRNKHECELR